MEAMATATFNVTRILCPTDFSPAADAAIDAAVAIAERFGARVELLHVWAPPVTAALDAAIIPTPEQIVAYTGALEESLAKAAARLPLPKDRVDRHLVQGIAWRDTIEFAEKKGFDLVVMSTHGRTGVAHFVMGSVTERVVRSAKVPVLVVPAPR